MMRLTPDRYSDGSNGYKEKTGPDIDRIRRIFKKMENEHCHDQLTLFPCCLIRQYNKRIKKRGQRFDKESFFLKWLEGEFRFSNIAVEYIIRDREPWEYESGDPSTIEAYRGDIREYFWVPKIYRKIADFIQTYLPHSNIDLDTNRIKLKIWRLKKSGIISELAKEIKSENLKKCPHDPQKQMRWKQNWRDIALAQEVARIIQNIPEKEIDRRTLMRKHMRKRNLTKPDLERIHGLMGSLGIRGRRDGYRNKTIFYYSTR